jgi:branched-chain amino acid aminotransferase
LAVNIGGPAAPTYLWLNGQVVPWAETTVHISKLGWSTVSGVFEGIKAYWNADEGQLYGLRLRGHYGRFVQSMRLQRMAIRWSADELIEATLELLRANGAREDTYVRPTAYFGDQPFLATGAVTDADVFIVTQPFTSGLGSGRTQKACVSSWTRIDDNVISPRVKCFSNYQNSRMALVEARQNGYDQPILLNAQGKVAEGALACVAIVREGTVITPSTTSGILESLTRRMVLDLCAELGIPTVEREVDRTELYVADEAFFCGTGAEVTPISQVDGYQLLGGAPGPVTARIEQAYHDAVRGRAGSRHATPVYAKDAVAAR